MPRWAMAGMLASMLGLLVVVALEAVELVGARRSAISQADEGEATLHALVERLLGPEVRLLPGSTPEGLAFAVPVPPGGRLLGSVVRPGVPRETATTAGESVEVLVDVGGDPRELLAFYADALVAQGFSVAPVFGRQPESGFLPSPGWISTPLHCLSEQGPGASAMIFVRDGRAWEVRVQVEGAPFPPCTGPGDGVLAPPTESVELPLLVPPAGVVVEPGIGGAGLRSREAAVTTDLSPAALATFYGEQLAREGWTVVERRDDPPVSWSLWMVPGGGDRLGFLSVYAPAGTDRRVLQLVLTFQGPEPAGRRGLP